MKLTHGTHQKNTEISYVRSWHACFHYLRLPLVNYPMNSWHDILSCQLFPLFEVRSYELAMVSSYDSPLFPLLEVVYGESANGFLTWDIESQFLFLTLETLSWKHLNYLSTHQKCLSEWSHVISEVNSCNLQVGMSQHGVLFSFLKGHFRFEKGRHIFFDKLSLGLECASHNFTRRVAICHDPGFSFRMDTQHTNHNNNMKCGLQNRRAKPESAGLFVFLFAVCSFTFAVSFIFAAYSTPNRTKQ